MNSVKLEITDLLGFCDLNGVDALSNEQIQKLEDYIEECNAGMNRGEPVVEDAIYDRLMEILRRINPDSDLANKIWEDTGLDDLDDTDAILRQNPMFSIMTVKDYDCDEMQEFVKRLPEDINFEAHVSVKLNGHGIRLKYKNGKFIQARSRARSSAGRDITPQISAILGDLNYIEALKYVDLCEIRGEWVLPFKNLDEARKYNPDIKSAFTAVASMGRDSATEDEWRLLNFVAYEFLDNEITFDTKESEYNYLEELGFETPIYWLIPDINKETIVDDLRDSIVPDCEEEIKPDENFEGGYQYYTDGLVFSINNTNIFRSIGDDGGHYKFGNMALKVGYWKQDMYSGYVQTILWMRGKTKITPVAIVAEEPDIIRYKEDDDYSNDEHMYILDKNLIENYNELGVATASGNRVKRVPLYEPNNLVLLDAFKGRIIHFRYGGEAGVVPCFDDGTPLINGKIKNLLSDDVILEDDDYDFSV